MAYTPWRYKRLSEQQWFIVKDFFKREYSIDEATAADRADSLARYMDMVWDTSV
jgi:hypothetical protein